MNDVDLWLSEVADLAQVELDRDAELRDQINLLLAQAQSPSCLRVLKHLAYTDAVLAIVVSRPTEGTA